MIELASIAKSVGLSAAELMRRAHTEDQLVRISDELKKSIDEQREFWAGRQKDRAEAQKKSEAEAKASAKKAAKAAADKAKAGAEAAAEKAKAAAEKAG